MKRITITLLQFLVVCLHAQKHDYTWISGAFIPGDTTSSDFIIDFKKSPPEISRITDSIEMFLSNTTFSDYLGELEFYSNGCIVRDATFSNMENGEYINHGLSDMIWSQKCGQKGYGNYPVYQGIFVIPFENGQRKLFHLLFDSSPPNQDVRCIYPSLMFSQIDMNANQTLGSIVIKDSLLLNGCLQAPIANKHANGRDWWVLQPDNVNHRFYRFLVSPENIQGPWIQDIENPTTTDSLSFYGFSEFSPDGAHLLINDVQTGTAIYDFDRCSGLLSNLRFIPMVLTQGYGYPAAFSPDSRFVYRVKGDQKTVEQYDLLASDLVSSREIVAIWDGTFDFMEPFGPYKMTYFWYFQHGPDGKLYSWAGGSRFMHVMNFPNRKGVQCNLVQRALKLPCFTNGANIYYPNYRLGPIDGSSCDTLGIDNHPVALFRYDLEDTTQLLQTTFTDLSYYEPTSWHWDFGDGATSQYTSPVHTYAQAGAYEVCLTVSNAFSSNTYCLQVQVGTSGMHELPVLPQAQVSPNPFGEELRISLPAKVSLQPRFCLYDLFGRQLKTQLLDDFETLVNTSGIPSGIYFWQLSWGGIVAQQGKVLKW